MKSGLVAGECIFEKLTDENVSSPTAGKQFLS